MAEQWFAICDKASGALLSTGSLVEDAKLPPNAAKIALAGPPDSSQMWDPSSRTFKPRPVSTDDDLAVAIAPRPQLDPSAAVGKPVLRDLSVDAAQAWVALDALATRTAGDAGATQAQKDATAALATAAYQRARRLAAKWAAAP